MAKKLEDYIGEEVYVEPNLPGDTFERYRAKVVGVFFKILEVEDHSGDKWDVDVKQLRILNAEEEQEEKEEA